MIRRNTRWLAEFNKTRYNEGEGEGSGGGNPPPTPPPSKNFTQADVDRFLAEDRRKHQAKQQALAQQLEQFQSTARLTEEEKQGLAAQIEELRNQSLTKEQQLTRDLEKHKETLKTTSETLAKERDTWQGRYGELLVSNQINAAATVNEAFRNDQVLDLLKPRAKVVQKKDEDGKPTDEFQVVIKFDDVDAKSGAPVVLELSPADTVKRMKELPDRFGNLFKSGVTPGVGKTKGSGPTGEPDISKMTAEQYREYRKTRSK